MLSIFRNYIFLKEVGHKVAELRMDGVIDSCKNQTAFYVL